MTTVLLNEASEWRRQIDHIFLFKWVNYNKNNYNFYLLRHAITNMNTTDLQINPYKYVNYWMFQEKSAIIGRTFLRLIYTDVTKQT